MDWDNRYLRLLRASHRKMRGEFAEANPWLVLEGDWGGQIYLTVPWRLVGPRPRIGTLLAELDCLAWACNQGQGAAAGLYEPKLVLRDMLRDADVPEETRRELEEWLRASVSGGMGGGRLEQGLWLHDEFRGHPVSLAQSRELLDLRA